MANYRVTYLNISQRSQIIKNTVECSLPVREINLKACTPEIRTRNLPTDPGNWTPAVVYNSGSWWKMTPSHLSIIFEASDWSRASYMTRQSSSARLTTSPQTWSSRAYRYRYRLRQRLRSGVGVRLKVGVYWEEWRLGSWEGLYPPQLGVWGFPQKIKSILR